MRKGPKYFFAGVIMIAGNGRCTRDTGDGRRTQRRMCPAQGDGRCNWEDCRDFITGDSQFPRNNTLMTDIGKEYSD